MYAQTRVCLYTHYIKHRIVCVHTHKMCSSKVNLHQNFHLYALVQADFFFSKFYEYCDKAHCVMFWDLFRSLLHLSTVFLAAVKIVERRTFDLLSRLILGNAKSLSVCAISSTLKVLTSLWYGTVAFFWNRIKQVPFQNRLNFTKSTFWLCLMEH